MPSLALDMRGICLCAHARAVISYLQAALALLEVNLQAGPGMARAGGCALSPLCLDGCHGSLTAPRCASSCQPARPFGELACLRLAVYASAL